MDKKLGLKIKFNGNPVTNAGFDKDHYIKWIFQERILNPYLFQMKK
ncbi:hypothetical protein [Sphingobacterium sp.]|nr:hypothetical protein [Sphingobacterium sp.]